MEIPGRGTAPSAPTSFQHFRAATFVYWSSCCSLEDEYGGAAFVNNALKQSVLVQHIVDEMVLFNGLLDTGLYTFAAGGNQQELHPLPRRESLVAAPPTIRSYLGPGTLFNRIFDLFPASQKKKVRISSRRNFASISTRSVIYE